jgi:uncharacterized protein YjiS (DUF1127 family)
MSNLCLKQREQAPLRKASTTSSENPKPPVSALAVLCLYRRRRDMFEPLTRKFTDWRLRRIAIRKLHTLDDRLLADVGTTRDGIRSFVSCIECRGVA